jgi:hypothetical protein
MTNQKPICDACHGSGWQRLSSLRWVECPACGSTGERDWTEDELNEFDQAFNAQIIAEIETLTSSNAGHHLGYPGPFTFNEIIDYVRQAHPELAPEQRDWFEDGLANQFEEAEYWSFLHSLPHH